MDRKEFYQNQIPALEELLKQNQEKLKNLPKDSNERKVVEQRISDIQYQIQAHRDAK